MSKSVQLALDLFTGIQATNPKTVREGLDDTVVEISAFDFNSLFYNGCSDEEMHNHNSMAILGDCLTVMKKNEKQLC